ncbi:unnamed protein product [Prunus armeniaca]|uniref:Uncharacterized protein n=1 Tax=Prunus armeniaca TaxID=36596 RepID=A0A6J5VNB9_PRUAR|nr:unnamed protein product [Prunus armeniaca]
MKIAPMGCRVGGCKELARVDMVGGGTNGWMIRWMQKGNTEGLMYNLCVTEEQQLNDRLGVVKRGERVRGLVVLFSEDS